MNNDNNEKMVSSNSIYHNETYHKSWTYKNSKYSSDILPKPIGK